MNDAHSPQRWLLLTSSTGTGHNMRADSLGHWARTTLGDDRVEIRVQHALEGTHRVYGFGVGLYNVIQRHAPWLHHVYFNYLEIAGMHRSASRILGADRFKAAVREFRPHRVISVHAHTNHGFFELARLAAQEGGFDAPSCLTYCGELFGGYGFSRHWANAAADGFIGATPEICAAARAIGLVRERTFPGGFLLRPPFYQSEAELRAQADEMAAELSLRPDAFTVMVSTGLAGANNHPHILAALAASGPEPLQVIMLCGRRTDTRIKLKRLAEQHPHLTVRALGPTDPNRMAALKSLASVVIARPGTGTTSEAIQLGVPLIHNGIGGIMPQELITVQYCKQHHCALVARTPRDIAATVRRLQRDPALTASIRNGLIAARPAGRPRDIVHWIANVRAHA